MKENNITDLAVTNPAHLAILENYEKLAKKEKTDTFKVKLDRFPGLAWEVFFVGTRTPVAICMTHCYADAIIDSWNKTKTNAWEYEERLIESGMGHCFHKYIVQLHMDAKTNPELKEKYLRGLIRFPFGYDF